MVEGAVTCILCDAQINVRTGNFYKFQLHMENDHDVFRHQDLVMALSFLEAEEQEVVIEKVLPRMRDVLDSAVKTAQNKTLSGPDTLHKRLSDMENISETTSEEVRESSNTEDRKHDEIPDSSPYDIKDQVDVEMKIPEGEKLLESESATGEELLERTTDEKFVTTLTTDENSVTMKEEKNRRAKSEEVLAEIETHSKSMKLRERKKMSSNLQKVEKTPPKEVLCPICDQKIKKYKFNTHKRNCQILRKLRLDKFMESKDEPGARSPQPKQPPQVHKAKDPAEKRSEDKRSEGKTVWTPELFECNVCNKQYTFKRHLMKHVQKAHVTLSSYSLM